MVVTTAIFLLFTKFVSKLMFGKWLGRWINLNIIMKASGTLLFAGMVLPVLFAGRAKADSFPTNVMFLGTQTTIAGSAYPDTFGLTALRTITTNLNGGGVYVGQAEAVASVYEVNPANVGQPVGLFSYIYGASSTNGYPNTLGTDSSHSDSVGNDFYGMSFGVATNVAHVNVYDAGTFLNYYIAADVPIPARVVNQSFTYGVYYDFVDQAFDNYADQFGVLFVSGAGFNNSPIYSPATCYNGIAVGVYNNTGSAYGPTPDGRSKPDITAWGNQDSVSSYSTPLVSGSAAILLQAGTRGDGGSDTNAATNMRTIKALLLNGAVKPVGWTNSPSAPLHTVYGAGILNLLNSYEQLAGGKHSYAAVSLPATGSDHSPFGSISGFTQSATNSCLLRGWDLDTITSSGSSDAVNHDFFAVTNVPKGAAYTATATLVWNRQSGQSAINNLGVFLYNATNGQLVCCSTSLVDNVQHVYVPSLSPGIYDLQVWKAGGGSYVSPTETYALAYEFFSAKSTVTPVGSNAIITWPVYPAGFLVEAATNYTQQNWVVVTNYTPVIVGNSYQLTVPTINTNSITWVTTTNVSNTNGIDLGPGPIAPGGATNVVSIPTYNNDLDLHYFRLRRPNL